MNSNENPKKSSNPEPFHDTDAKKDMRKEITGYSGYADTRIHAEYKKPWTKSQGSRTGSYARKLVPGVSQEYRVLRDYRMIQKANVDVIQESLQNSSIDNHQVTSSVIDKSSGGDLIDQQQSGSRNSDSHIQSQDLERQGGSCPPHGIYTEPSGNDGPSLPEEKHITPSSSTVIVAGEVVDNSQAHCASSANSVSSSSDPIHVPSAGTVGVIRREVGVVGGRRKPSDFITVHASLSSNSFANPRVFKRASSSIETFGQSATAFKSSYANSFSTSDHSVQNVSVNRSFAAHQYNVRPHQLVGHQKVKHPIVEWKPKPAKKRNPNSPGEIGTTLITSSCVDSSSNSSNVQIVGLSEKILHVNISNDDQVIIPHHLQVSLSEQTGLTFGSFGAVFDSTWSTKGIVSSSQAFVTVEESDHQTSLSIPASVPVGSNKDPAAVQSDSTNSVARTTSNSPTSAPKHDHSLTVNSESVSPRDIESYPDIGLVQSHIPSYSSSKPHQLHNPANLQSFSVQEYEPQMRFGTPFSGTIVDDNAERQGLSSAYQAFNSHVASGTPVSSIPIIQQQQQPLTQFYPQVHMSHYPNFFSYCPIYSPVYAPPMAMPNYANPTYPHPSNGSNYLVMPTGNSHLASSGMNYTASQYKPVVHSGSPTTGFGNYTNQGGYNVGTPRAIGTTAGFEDVGRIKYKDNNLYVQAPQAEAPDIWIRNSTELANLQSPSYYTLPGQAVAAPSAAFLPGAHAVHSSLGSAAVAAQSSHLQYANVYHPAQPPGHHMVHQQAVLGLGANAGGGVGAANAQVGAYQQNQNGHFGWTNNF